jgi:hypothetical protein
MGAHDDVEPPPVTKTGREMSGDEFEALVAEAEAGYDLSGPRGARIILRALQKREAFWRARVGDEDYERSVERWRAQANAPEDTR